MITSNTLLIRHMPSELSYEEKEQFFKHFGAINIKVIGSKHKKSSNIYAVFETHDAAEAALKHLHQTNVLGQLLAVEFARGVNAHNISTAENIEREKRISSGSKVTSSQKYYENFLSRLNNWTSKLDFNVPPPVHLKYQYPPPTIPVLENILKTLATIPRFYTQVLHLMNKMNLPCPFMEEFPIEANVLSSYKVDKRTDDVEDIKEGLSTNFDYSQTYTASEDESEIGSDDENRRDSNYIVPSKRQLPEKKRVVKRPKFIKPINKSSTHENKPTLTAEEVFEKTSEKDQLQMRKIEVKITPDLSSIQEAEETQKSVCTVEGFEKLEMSEAALNEAEEKTNAVAEEDENVGSCITEQELASNRISARDQRILPVFKNYQPGSPSCRLYIKNLAKQVVARDLHFIYRRYLLTNMEEEQGTMFDVRLMQEGRMKGQAFVNLQSVEIAQKALKETNGFILKDKPMVVQFARSSKVKENK